MPAVFLSYGRGDDVEPFDPQTSFLARLHRDLSAAGFTVWFDRVCMPSRGLTFHRCQAAITFPFHRRLEFPFWEVSLRGHLHPERSVIAWPSWPARRGS